MASIDDGRRWICMLNVHSKQINSAEDQFTGKALIPFGREFPRRLQLAFNDLLNN